MIQFSISSSLGLLLIKILFFAPGIGPDVSLLELVDYVALQVWYVNNVEETRSENHDLNAQLIGHWTVVIIFHDVKECW